MGKMTDFVLFLLVPTELVSWTPLGTGACEGFARAMFVLDALAMAWSKRRSAADDVEDDVSVCPFKELTSLRLLCLTAGAARIRCPARPRPWASLAGVGGDAELVPDTFTVEVESVSDGEFVEFITCWSKLDIA